MRKIFFLLILLLVCKQNINAQQADIYSIGLLNISSDTNLQLLRYNYNSFQHNSVMALKRGTTYYWEWNTIDPYNGRFFFIGDYDTVPGNRIFTIDLTTLSIDTTTQYNIENLGEIEYDMFQNKLFVRSNYVLKSYDLFTKKFDTICVLPSPNTPHATLLRAYNPIDQEFMYLHGDSNNWHFVLVDIRSASIKAMTPAKPPVGNIVFDIVTKKYYGSYFKDIVSFDPLTGGIEKIVTINDYYSHFAGQQPVFDHTQNLYILNYKDTNLIDKIVFVDVINKTVINNTYYPLEWSFIQRLYGKYNPLTIYRDSTLITTYGKSYEWYCNDSLVLLTETNSIVPTKNGCYKTRVTFFDNRTAFSNIVCIGISGAHSVIKAKSHLVVYPNPTADQLNIESVEIFTMLEVKDVLGRTLLLIENPIENTIDVSSLTQGVYYLSAITKEKQQYYANFVRE